VCRGVFLSNELVDALPFHVLEKRDGKVWELYVDDSGAPVLGELSTRALAPHAQAVALTLEEGQRHAVSLEARSWLTEVAGRLECGYLATIDYGKRLAAGDINAPRSYRRHTVDDRILAAPGARDLTAPVDFSALVSEGERLGLATASFTSMARFLLDCGLLDWLPAGSDAATVTDRARLKTLVHPEGMGEAFKVLVQTKRVYKC
jgi:SAM-dependent MidA family methyltransferase